MKQIFTLEFEYDREVLPTEIQAAILEFIGAYPVKVKKSAQQSVQADKCPACAGTGRSTMSDPAHDCYACNGTGIRR